MASYRLLAAAESLLSRQDRPDWLCNFGLPSLAAVVVILFARATQVSRSGHPPTCA